MRVRIEGFSSDVEDFLRDNDYPHLDAWPSEVLHAYCILVRIEADNGDVAGYIWATWHQFLTSTLFFHVCVSPAYRGRWLTKGVMADLEKLAEFFGASGIATKTPKQDGGRTALLVEKLLTRRFGFEKKPDDTLYKRIEANYGRT